MKPILFNTEMARAIQDNRKTVTRRVVKERELIDRPPYRPGDILYVPQAWKCRKPPNPKTLGYEVVFRDGEIIKFQFSDEKRFKKWEKYWGKPDTQWQSPYFMPREAARIFLRVTDVRLEQLNDISERSAQSEGASLPLAAQKDPDYAEYTGGYYNAFAELWDSTIKPNHRALYGWDANPWVWVIEFERISKEVAEYDT